MTPALQLWPKFRDANVLKLESKLNVLLANAQVVAEEVLQHVRSATPQLQLELQLTNEADSDAHLFTARIQRLGCSQLPLAGSKLLTTGIAWPGVHQGCCSRQALGLQNLPEYQRQNLLPLHQSQTLLPGQACPLGLAHPSPSCLVWASPPCLTRASLPCLAQAKPPCFARASPHRLRQASLPRLLRLLTLPAWRPRLKHAGLACANCKALWLGGAYTERLRFNARPLSAAPNLKVGKVAWTG